VKNRVKGDIKSECKNVVKIAKILMSKINRNCQKAMKNRQKNIAKRKTAKAKKRTEKQGKSL
jgi:hypothetical protein